MPMAFSWAVRMISTTSLSILVAVSALHARAASPPRYWLLTVSSAVISNVSLMPRRVTMLRASLVACSMSLDAPLVTLPKISSSALRPPVSVAIFASASSLESSTVSASGVCIV